MIDILNDILTYISGLNTLPWILVGFIITILLEKAMCRGKIDRIAIDCGFSRQKVWRIIKRLEENKTIWGYHTVIDYEKLGLKRYFVLIKRAPKPLTKTLNDIIIKRRIKNRPLQHINI